MPIVYNPYFVHFPLLFWLSTLFIPPLLIFPLIQFPLWSLDPSTSYSPSYYSGFFSHSHLSLSIFGILFVCIIYKGVFSKSLGLCGNSNKSSSRISCLGERGNKWSTSYFSSEYLLSFWCRISSYWLKALWG